MRIYRSNPFNAVGRLPHAPRLLAFIAVVAAGLGAFGVWAEQKARSDGAEHLRVALAAEGHAAAEVEVVGKGCGRARRLYRWEAATASGSACVGPGDRVEIRSA